MPNVLKVFLENGQTKSFKYDSSTTVQVRYYLKKKVTKHFVSFQATFVTKHSKVKGYLLSFKEFSSLFPYFFGNYGKRPKKRKTLASHETAKMGKEIKISKVLKSGSLFAEETAIIHGRRY